MVKNEPAATQAPDANPTPGAILGLALSVILPIALVAFAVFLNAAAAS